MPYKYKKVGDNYVVYKKSTGKRVGATAGNKEALYKYLSALHINANENNTMKSTKEQILRECVREQIRRILSEEQLTDLGNMKTTVRSIDLFFTLQRNEQGDILAYPVDQTRLFNAVNRYGYTAATEPLSYKIDNTFSEPGCSYVLRQGSFDPGKPLIFTYQTK